MATVQIDAQLDYPESDGRPIGETPIHRDNLGWSIDVLRRWFFHDFMIYVSGNMMMYYEQGNRYRSVSPDIFVVRGIPRLPERRVYMTWKEGKTPDAAIELTSKSTKREDLKQKFQLYQDVLKIKEYFLFDPECEYLKPPLQGYRLVRGRYEPIKPIDGRLPSKVLGLHLDRDGELLRFYHPEVDVWLPTAWETRKEAEQLRRENEELRRLLAQRQ